MEARGEEQTGGAMRRSVLIIFNPAAGPARRSRVAAVTDRLRALGCRVTVWETRRAGDGVRLAAEASGVSPDIVVAAGGDGTVNEVINGLKGSGLALGLIPCGTANALAKELGLDAAPRRVAEVVARAPLRPVRLGVMNGRRFVMMAGAGFDAEVIASVRAALKSTIGPLAYVFETLRQGITYPFTEFSVEIEGRRHRAVEAVISNARFYGGAFVMAPEADLEADMLVVTLFRKGGYLRLMGYGAALLAGRIAARPDVEVFKARRIVIEGPPSVPLHLDGDSFGHLPAVIEVDPEPLQIARPA